MASGLISVGISGIQAAQLGLLTAEHNITNANTAGYTRQRTIQATNVAMLTGSGYVGQGVHVSTIERMYDGFLSSQVNSAQTVSSELEAYYAEITQIDNMLADSSSGLSPALQDFFTGIQKVSANPSLSSARQTLVSSAQALVARYQALEDRLAEMADGVNTQITSTVSTINSYSQQIAKLNDAIVVARSSLNQPPNDLLDQRDQLVADLNKLIRVTTTTNSDGTYNVYIGNGQQLVTGTQVMTMTALPATADPSRITVGLKNAAGTQELPESLISGGTLGGLLAFRSESLDHAMNELGRNAASLALTFNAQNALGQDLLGQTTGVGTFQNNFFNLSQPVVTANTQNTGTASVSSTFVSPPPIDGGYSLARTGAGYTLTRESDGQVWSNATLAGLQGAVPASEGLTLTGANIAVGGSTQVYGAAASGGNFYTKLTGSDYRLGFDGTNYTVTRLSDNTVWTNTDRNALAATVAGSEGFNLSISAGMASGDTFLIQPTRTAARNLTVNSSIAADVRLVAAAMPVTTSAAGTNTGSGTVTAAASLLGFGTPAFPAAGITLTYNSAGTSLSLVGVPAGAQISVTSGGATTLYDPGTAIPYTSGAQISVAGVSFSISGTLNNGDTFALAKNTAGVSDGRNALALSQLQTKNTMSGKTTTLQAAYAQLVADNGNKTREIEVKSEAQAALLEQSQDARDALSGVNLYEEAANLMRYQQAYQASAKAMAIGNELFDALLAIF